VTWSCFEKTNHLGLLSVRLGTQIRLAHMNTLPKYRFWSQPLKVQLALQGIVSLLYLLLFLVIQPIGGYTTAVTASFLPVIMSGLLLGVRGGIVYAIFIVALNLLLTQFVENNLGSWGATLLGDLLLVICGAGAGWIREQFAAQAHIRLRLAISEERLRSVITSAPVILFVLDRNGIFTLSEGKALAVLGLQPGEAVGQSVFDLFSKAEGFLTDVRRALAGEAFTSIARGQGLAFETRFSPVHDEKGQLIGTIGVSVDVRSRIEAEEAYRTVVETSRQGLVILQDSRLVFANPAQAEMTGYSIDELLAMTPQQTLELAHPDDRELVAKRLQEPTDEQSRHPRVEIRMLRKDGQVRWVELYSTPVEYRGKSAAQIVVLDVTERKMMEAALIEAESLRLALDQERELKELKGRFISMVSHQFRTPMSVINTTSYLLENYHDKLAPEKREEYFGKIRSQINRLDEMIEKVLTISATEEKGLAFAPRRLDLEVFCHDLAVEMQLLTPSETKKIAFSATGDLSAAMADDNLLHHILTNLLSNAIKYSPNGGDVIFNLERQEDEAVFQISDSGIGIPADDQKHLFEPFHRGENVGSIKGSGLGLKLVKDFVDLHGGTITCVSEAGKGTTFTVRLPIVQEEYVPAVQGVDGATRSSGGA